MDTKRLQFVADVCPLSEAHSASAFEATRWHAEASYNADQLILLPNGFRATVMENRLLSWHRTFTADNRPVRFSSRSLIKIEEWVPSTENMINHHGWINFGVTRRQAIAVVPTEGAVEQHWSGHAKRHLKVFQKQTDITLRLGELEELRQPYAKSHIGRSMRNALWDMTERHVKAHQETVDVLIAESKTDGIMAGFVAGNCAEARSSIYLLGFYLPPAAKTYAKTGLVKWWFERTREKQLAYCNFGDICGAKPSIFDSSRGYSLFKTHFGINRVHLPRSYWRVSFFT